MYESELEKFIVRRAPLGTDRHFRRYWWGVAGARAAVYVEQDTGAGAGRLGSWTSPSELQALLDALDKRGVRELALQVLP